MNHTDSEKEFVNACIRVGELLGLILVMQMTRTGTNEVDTAAKERLLTRKEAANRMNVSVSTFDGWRRQGVVKPVKGLGAKTVRFRESDLERLITARAR